MKNAEEAVSTDATCGCGDGESWWLDGWGTRQKRADLAVCRNVVGIHVALVVECECW